MSSNPVHGEVYSIQHFVIKFVSDLRQVVGSLRVLRFPPPIKLTDITEILLKVVSNTINQSTKDYCRLLKTQQVPVSSFVCLYTCEFWLSLWKIVLSSVILLLPLFHTCICFLNLSQTVNYYFSILSLYTLVYVFYVSKLIFCSICNII